MCVGSVFWAVFGIDVVGTPFCHSFLGTSLREWLLCAGVISYKGEEGSCSLSWGVGAEASLCSCSTSPQSRGLGDFHLVRYSACLCFLLNPIFFCIPIIKAICNSCMTSRFSSIFSAFTLRPSFSPGLFCTFMQTWGDSWDWVTKPSYVSSQVSQCSSFWPRNRIYLLGFQ